MKTHWKTLLVSAAFAVAVAPASAMLSPANAAQAAAPTIQAGATVVHRGSTLTVGGTFDSFSWVTLRAIDSAGNIVAFDAAKSDAEGGYSFTFAIPSHTALGSLQLFTGAGEDVAQATIGVTLPDIGGGNGSVPNAPSGQEEAEEEAAATTDATVEDGVVTVRPTTETGADGRSQATAEVSADAVRQALEQGDGRVKVVVEAADADVIVAGLSNEALQLLLETGGDSVEVEIVSPFGTYVLPISIVDLASLAAELGVSAEDVTIRFTIGTASAEQSASVDAAADGTGATIVSETVEMSVDAVTPSGASLTLHFGNTYASRTIAVTVDIDPDRTTGVRYDPATGTIVFVPTRFATENGTTVATLKRNGNSLYTVVAREKTFADVGSDHWGQDEIELLASKLILNGMTETTFEPYGTVTRAQFAAMIVRALGLDETGTSEFSDVASGAWYAGAVGAAYESGLVQGYEDGTFRPDRHITRQELAVLIDNALRFAGDGQSGEGGAEALSRFADRSSIASWAQDAVAAAAAAGIVEGRGDGTFGPAADANRAEAAAMLQRLLQFVEFIN